MKIQRSKDSASIMTKAPSFFLTTVGTARMVGGPPGPAIPLLLIFHGYKGSETAININIAIRDQYPSVEQLQISSVVDLHHIPRYMRAAVELTLAAAYRQSANRVPQNLDPTEYVVMVPDWEGKVTAAFGMQERVNDIGLALITSPWTIFDTYNGPEPFVAVEKMLNAAINEQSASSFQTNMPL